MGLDHIAKEAYLTLGYPAGNWTLKYYDMRNNFILVSSPPISSNVILLLFILMQVSL